MTKVHTVTGGSTYMNEYAYTDDKLTQVKHNTEPDTVSDVTYNFSYDALGRASQVCVGTQPLSTNTYNTNGTLQKVQYGNNDESRYTYDAFKRMTGIRFDSDTADRYAYTYNSEGRIAYVKDELLDRIRASEYDDAGRPMRIRTYQDGVHVYSGEIGYDSYNNLSSFKEQVGTGYSPYTTTFAYDSENKPTTVQYGDAYNRVVNAYDLLGRVTTRTVRAGTSGQYAEYQSSFAYLAGGHGTYSTTPLVSGITQSGHGFAYTYDDVGNILSATYNGGTPVTYAYDNLGQLTRVNDLYDLTAGGSGTTWVYAYDRGGNIQSKTAYVYTTGTLGTPFQTIAYTYDSTWKDKLASYNGAALSYDAIGNPLTDGTWTYTWQAGRQLASMTDGTTTASFDYNADGLRIRKTVGSTVTEYMLHGKNIVHLIRGYVSLHIFYDAQGRPAVVEYYNGSTTVRYAYVHNLQSDIIAILDPAGTTVVQYRYDAWGKQMSKTGSMASTLGTYNPFRYRGYVFDEETGLYYLRSRYYNPTWTRFVNADILTNASNFSFTRSLFTYTQNSPILKVDPSGYSIWSVLESIGEYFGNIGRAVLNTSDAFSLEASAGFGLGIETSVGKYGVSAIAKIDPLYGQLNKGSLTAGGNYEVSTSINIGNFTIGSGKQASHPYSFDDSVCTCNLTLSQLENCPLAIVNQDPMSTEVTIGVGVYAIVGASIEGSVNLNTLLGGFYDIFTAISGQFVSRKE